ncbi:MAG: ORF6N domain-containing protein [Bacteroidia bacterium]|nr:ORF6N domain-containing protein [Bacteroidia bacterium]MCF8427712.1 ORF6N domain-containing protein [Bacteroidia bacterium]MCF8447579.1 ORF6N domain-containing protein [Bacteroidia bacterium]
MPKEINGTTPIHEEQIISKILLIRDRRVMLDSDLSALYSVPTKVLNQTVKRNISRFPWDFMFQLNEKEFDDLKSQFVTSRWGRRRTLTFAYFVSYLTPTSSTKIKASSPSLI